MKGILVRAVAIMFLFAGCDSKKLDREKLKSEIVQAEADFNKMADEKGLREAFSFFADSNAVIKRGKDSLIFGTSGIENFYSSPKSKQKVSLVWKPDFVDVAASGELGYTYGKYTFTAWDSVGNKTERHGVFHTVWKKQRDGRWKYVWD